MKIIPFGDTNEDAPKEELPDFAEMIDFLKSRAKEGEATTVLWIIVSAKGEHEIRYSGLHMETLLGVMSHAMFIINNRIATDDIKDAEEDDQ